MFSGGDEDLARAVAKLFDGSEFCKALAQAQARENYIRILTQLKEVPARLAHSSYKTLPQKLPEFVRVQSMVAQYINGTFTRHFNLDEKSADFEQQLTELEKTLDPEVGAAMFENSIKTAAEKILAVIENAEFFVKEEKGYMRISGAALEEHDLTNAFQEMQISKGLNPLPGTTISRYDMDGKLLDAYQTHLSKKN